MTIRLAITYSPPPLGDLHGYPQEGLGWVHLQSMHPHDVEYSLHIYNMIAFSTDLYCNIVHVAFYSLAYMFVEDCICYLLMCCPCILQAKGITV